ncbi:hypothetical protein F2Q69_00042937 [Brassica cretica]|uniref:Arabidopsis retrotransposon Orf1 C-terminal domain-containing protein n=1 Tax=Brassica cretica TaxID=69181 RepID=A0A8S9NPI8_BRACR|nr:hypothetical protein F2Q69_00042937 [Brassica cretica]
MQIELLDLVLQVFANKISIDNHRLMRGKQRGATSFHRTNEVRRSRRGPSFRHPIRPRGLVHRVGYGKFATHPQVLYPELVCQFMATVNVYYAHESAKKASEGVLTFFICGIRYRVPLLTLCTIYGFETERQHVTVPDFPGIGTFWSLITTGFLWEPKFTPSIITNNNGGKPSEPVFP